MQITALRGAYPVTPTDWPADHLIDTCASVLSARPALLQYRAKPSPDPQVAVRLKHLCEESGVPLVINDQLELASARGVGVHLGRDDANVGAARSRLGTQALIGVSVYDDIDRAVQAVEDGADYVSFGRFFPSRTKPEASPARPDILRTARSRLNVPVAVIGGITRDNAGMLVRHGADLLACVDGIFAAADPAQAVRELNSMLSQT